MSANDAPARRIKSTETALRIFEAIQQLDGATASEIAERLDLAASTVHDHLQTMEFYKYVVRTDDGFDLGLKFLNHGTHAQNKFEVLNLAKPILRRLVSETGATAWLCVEEFGRSVQLVKHEGEHGVVGLDREGVSAPMHCTASGKAMLARYPDDQVDEIIETHGLPQITDATITDREELAEELETIREQGFALNDGESTDGVRCVASPVLVNGTVVGALSVPGPRHRLNGARFREEVPELVLAASNELELQMTDFHNAKLYKVGQM